MRQDGITLFDLMIALAISALLFSAAIPTLNPMIEKYSSESVSRQIYHAYQLGRQYSINHHQNVTICGSNSGTQCEREWSKYILVFVDADNDQEISTGDTQILTSSVDAERGSITTRVALSKPHTIVTPRGDAKFAGSMIYCPASNDASFAQRVTWNPVGRPYLGRDVDGDGIIEYTDGHPIRCPQ